MVIVRVSSLLSASASRLQGAVMPGLASDYNEERQCRNKQSNYLKASSNNQNYCICEISSLSQVKKFSIVVLPYLGVQKMFIVIH